MKKRLGDWFRESELSEFDKERAKSLHCEHILKIFSLVHWDPFGNSFIILCAIAQKEAFEGFQREEKYERRLVYNVHPAAHIITCCQHSEHDALGPSPCMTESSKLPFFPSLKSYQHNEHNKTKVKIKTFWKLKSWDKKDDILKIPNRYRTSVASEGW